MHEHEHGRPWISLFNTLERLPGPVATSAHHWCPQCAWTLCCTVFITLRYRSHFGTGGFFPAYKTLRDLRSSHSLHVHTAVWIWINPPNSCASAHVDVTGAEKVLQPSADGVLKMLPVLCHDEMMRCTKPPLCFPEGLKPRL